MSWSHEDYGVVGENIGNKPIHSLERVGLVKSTRRIMGCLEFKNLLTGQDQFIAIELCDFAMLEEVIAKLRMQYPGVIPEKDDSNGTT